MSIVIVTGAAGLIGSEAVRFFEAKGLTVVGIDNNMRKEFFGQDACTHWNLERLKKTVKNYIHYAVDIRDISAMEKIFKRYGTHLEVVIHAAAQPSHDWAAQAVQVDFSVNANGTLNLLECTRQYAQKACFIYLSTNKVYGDTPNALPLIEKTTRYDIAPQHPYHGVGIDESMSIDQSKHSLFGVSKLSADLMVQEYGRYFGMYTGCFRGGCLTGPAHSGTQLHGFLSYLMRCTVLGKPFTVLGYKGKQVRDNIHSFDLVNALWHFSRNPKRGAVYNIGGGMHNHCSVLEAIAMCEAISGCTLPWTYSPDNRIGDHIWWVSDVRAFRKDFPEWGYRYDQQAILTHIFEVTKEACYERV